VHEVFAISAIINQTMRGWQQMWNSQEEILYTSKYTERANLLYYSNFKDFDERYTYIRPPHLPKLCCM